MKTYRTSNPNYRTSTPIQAPRKTFRPRWKEIGATAAVMALAATGTYTALDIAAGSPQPAVEATTPACPTEDSNGCFWDAHAHGTTGKSFYADEAGNIYYLPVAIEDTPEYQSVAECAKQLKGFSRDAMALSTELTGYWASDSLHVRSGATSEDVSPNTYGEWVVTDNLQPMQDRYDYLIRTFCSE